MSSNDTFYKLKATIIRNAICLTFREELSNEFEVSRRDFSAYAIHAVSRHILVTRGRVQLVHRIAGALPSWREYAPRSICLGHGSNRFLGSLEILSTVVVHGRPPIKSTSWNVLKTMTLFFTVCEVPFPHTEDSTRRFLAPFEFSEFSSIHSRAFRPGEKHLCVQGGHWEKVTTCSFSIFFVFFSFLQVIEHPLEIQNGYVRFPATSETHSSGRSIVQIIISIPERCSITCKRRK